MSQTNELEIMERIALDLEGVEESLASSFNQVQKTLMH